MAKHNLFRFPSVDFKLVAELHKDMALCTPLNELNECTFADTHRAIGSVVETSSVFPLGKGTFGGVEVSVPNNPARALSKQFCVPEDGGDFALDVTSYQENAHFRNSLAKRYTTL